MSRAHGLKGEVVLKTFDPSSTVLEEVERLVLITRGGKKREVTIQSVGESPGSDLLLTLKGVQQREYAAELVGATAHVYRDDLEQPADGEFFHGDLVGLEAFTPDGKRLGVVEEVWSTGPVPNLCIRDGKEELLVPFAEEFVPKVDLAGKRVTIIPLTYEVADDGPNSAPGKKE
ncbi:MAG: 16S rRNA processing protein RimM [Archangium sp.]|nr:16S rRNA processing protein RimM [Archangium sp.]